MASITLKYGAGSSVTLPLLSEKGLSDPDWFEMFPAIVNTSLDGLKGSQFRAFRRKVRLDFGVIADRNNRLALLYWLLDNNRTADYGTETNLELVPQNPDGYENEWLENISDARRFVLELDETTVRTTFPT